MDTNAWSTERLTEFLSLTICCLTATGMIAAGVAVLYRSRLYNDCKGLVVTATKALHGPGYDLLIDYTTNEGDQGTITATSQSTVTYRAGEHVNVSYRIDDPYNATMRQYSLSMVGRALIVVGLILVFGHFVKVSK